jgi:Na+-transporting NADH:ubiquinone oxidoreductase subunit NqrD
MMALSAIFIIGLIIWGLAALVCRAARGNRLGEPF